MNRIFSVAAVAGIIAFFLWLPEPAAPQAGAWPSQPSNSFVLRGVRLFDGEEVRARVDVRVRDGLIDAVGAKVAGDGLPEFAADGHTLLPALIDAHTHNFMGARHDALRFGVGTQIDLFTSVDTLESARRQRAALERVDTADMWSAGTLVTARGGHGTQFGLDIPTLDGPESAQAFIDARVAEGSDFIKLVYESGSAWGRDIPTLDLDALTAAIAAAHARGKLAVVHVGTQAEAADAITAGADGLVHAFGDEPLDASLAALIAQRAAFVVPTLTVLESASGRAARLHEDARIAPYLSPEQRDSLMRGYPRNDRTASLIDVAAANVRALHAAGVTILAGSDAPNPGTAHGASLHRELQLLVDAGLTPRDALTAATAAAADAFGLEDRGRVRPGLRADLLLVAGDPTADITATRAIVAVWKNGHRVARPRQDAASDADALADGALGTAGWSPTSDRIQGGSSEVSVEVRDGVIVAVGEVRRGGMWPWAGAMRMLGTQPMAAVDASSFSALELSLRSATSVNLLFFSGASQQSPPQVWPVPAAPAWTTIRVPFAAVPGLDPKRLRAIAVVAGPEPGPVRIELSDAMLR